MTLIAVIPTMSMARVEPLIRMIQQNTCVPDKVFVMNNSGVPCYDAKNCMVVNYAQNVGVNATWNTGLEFAVVDGAYLSILNDDIEIPKTFFETILKDFEAHPKAGVVCPVTNGKDAATAKGRFVVMGKREGWAFTIRSGLVPLLPKIPPSLFIFCGDNWLFIHTRLLGYYWLKDFDCRISHQVGATLKENRPLRRLLAVEKVECRKALAEYIKRRRK